MVQQKENKIWVDKEGIVHTKIVRLVGEKGLSELIRKLQEVVIGLLDKPKILVDIENLEYRALLHSSLFRKTAVKQAKDFIQNIGFEKVAVFGTGIRDRTVASFVISAIRIKNIRIFKTKEEALRWLKEP